MDRRLPSQIDISKLGLTDLRSRLTIIPQDPTILSGTLRSTLDVFDEYDDHEIVRDPIIGLTVIRFKPILLLVRSTPSCTSSALRG